MKKYIRVLLLAALVCSLLAGCSIETKSSKDSQDESKYHPVSYTHLDVYKRQILHASLAATTGLTPSFSSHSERKR